MCFENASSCEAYLITLPQGTATVKRAEALAEAMLGCQPTDEASGAHKDFGHVLVVWHGHEVQMTFAEMPEGRSAAAGIP